MAVPTFVPACHSRAERRILQDDNIGFIVMWVVLDKTDCNGEKSNSLSLTFVRQPTALVANKLLPALAKNMLTAYFS